MINHGFPRRWPLWSAAVSSRFMKDFLLISDYMLFRLNTKPFSCAQILFAITSCNNSVLLHSLPCKASPSFFSFDNIVEKSIWYIILYYNILSCWVATKERAVYHLTVVRTSSIKFESMLICGEPPESSSRRPESCECVISRWDVRSFLSNSLHNINWQPQSRGCDIVLLVDKKQKQCTVLIITRAHERADSHKAGYRGLPKLNGDLLAKDIFHH